MEKKIEESFILVVLGLCFISFSSGIGIVISIKEIFNYELVTKDTFLLKKDIVDAKDIEKYLELKKEINNYRKTMEQYETEIRRQDKQIYNKDNIIHDLRNQINSKMKKLKQVEGEMHKLEKKLKNYNINNQLNNSSVEQTDGPNYGTGLTEKDLQEIYGN